MQLVPILMAPLAIGLLGGGDKRFWLAMIVVNLAAFLLLALLCHGELYRGGRRRRGSRNSTCGSRSAA